MPAVGLAVLLAIGVAGLGLVLGTGNPSEDVPGRTGPLALVSIDAPSAGAPEDAFPWVEKLPVGLPSGEGHAVAPGTRLARSSRHGGVGRRQHDPVVLRCGLARPSELSATSQLRMISDVQWLELPGSDSSTWVIVDRGVYVALTVPTDAGTGPLQDISTTVRSPPKQPVKTAP